MKTKTIMFGVIAMLAMAMFASSLVLAEENATPNLISENTNSIQSNVSDVSSGKIFWKEVGLWFTFNQERKAEKEMGLAQMRLQQAEYATQHNMTKVAEKALDAYEKLIGKAGKRMELAQKTGNSSAGAIKLAAMDQAILAHQERITKLSSMLENANLTAEQKVRLEEKIAHAENVTLHLQEVQSDKEEKMKIRLMAEGNLTETEAEALINDAKDKTEEIVDGAKNAWKNFKDEAKSNNMTAKELAKERRQEFRDEMKSSISEGKGSNKSD